MDESFKTTNIDIEEIDNVHIVLEPLFSIGMFEIASTSDALLTVSDSGVCMDGKIKIEKPIHNCSFSSIEFKSKTNILLPFGKTDLKYRSVNLLTGRV